MTDDLQRFDPFAEQTDRGYRGSMRPRETGKWVRLDDVALLRMQADHLRRELAAERAKVAMFRGGWSEDVCRVFARGHDREEAAQMGEPDPWSTPEAQADPEWQRERIACVRAGCGAVARHRYTWGEDQPDD